MTLAKKVVQPPQFAAFSKARTVKCKAKNCRTKVKIRGAHALELCDKHKKEHTKARLKEAAKRRKTTHAKTKAKAKARPMPSPAVPQNDFTQAPQEAAPVQSAPQNAPHPTHVAQQASVAHPPEGTRIPAPRAPIPQQERVEETPAPGSSPGSGLIQRVLEPEPSRRPANLKQGDFREALKIITSSERKNEGWRHGTIGTTGCGKTTLQRKIINSSSMLTLIHDDMKLEAQYPGSVVTKKKPRETGADLLEQVTDDQETQIVFRGDPFTGTMVEVEDVGALTLQLTRVTRKPVRLVIDELDRAVTDGGNRITSQSLVIAFAQGRSLGLSVLWSTQSPQRAPVQCIDQSSTIAICRLGPRALLYLDERLRFEKDLLATVPTLSQANENGTCEFVLYEQGKEWNRTIYSITVGG